MSTDYTETPLAQLTVDGMGATVRDVKQAEHQALSVLKRYVDAKIEADLVTAINDPEFTGNRERKELREAETELENLMRQLLMAHS